jgi:hypothetical protein
MTRQMRILGSFALAACGVAGCNQATPPAVAVVPAEVTTTQAAPATPAQPVPDVKVDRISDGGKFTFPDDIGGKSLAKIVTPPVPAAMPAAVALTQRDRPIPDILNSAPPQSFDATSVMPRLPMPETRPVRPAPLPDRVPIDIGVTLATLPARSELATGPLTRVEARNVNIPVELPLLSSRPVSDRAPLTDPTIEFTAQSAISSNLPLRTEPTGFMRINLPDPFENTEAAKPRTPIVENPNRSLGNPPAPK